MASNKHGISVNDDDIGRWVMVRGSTDCLSVVRCLVALHKPGLLTTFDQLLRLLDLRGSHL
jgi:hypothetical protein